MSREILNGFTNDSDKETSAKEAVKRAFEKSIWLAQLCYLSVIKTNYTNLCIFRRQRVEKYRKKSFKQLSSRHQQLIENYINSQLGCLREE